MSILLSRLSSSKIGFYGYAKGPGGEEERDLESGGASRFFFCAKVSTAERNLGMPKGKKNMHCTVKPRDLMRWLCKLTRTPSGGVVLDPFLGSGTTGMACVDVNRSFIGIELDKHYIEIAEHRINAAQPTLDL